MKCLNKTTLTLYVDNELPEQLQKKIDTHLDSCQKCKDMLREIRAHALLDGVRGKPPVDKKAIINTLLRMGQLVQDFPEIAELDINPLIVYNEGLGALAIDMRLVLTPD